VNAHKRTNNNSGGVVHRVFLLLSCCSILELARFLFKQTVIQKSPFLLKYRWGLEVVVGLSDNNYMLFQFTETSSEEEDRVGGGLNADLGLIKFLLLVRSGPRGTGEVGLLVVVLVFSS